MTRIEKAALSLSTREDRCGECARRLGALLVCVSANMQPKEREEVEKRKVAIPTDMLIAFGALFLLGTQERGYQMMDAIDQAAEFATTLRDTIEGQTGELW